MHVTTDMKPYAKFCGGEFIQNGALQMYKHCKLINRQLCVRTRNGTWIALKSVASLG